MADLNHQLSPEHLVMLRDGSGISDEVIAARDYQTVTDKEQLIEAGFSVAQRRVPALLIPSHTSDGNEGSPQIRPNSPRVRELRHRGKLADGTYPQRVSKYEQLKGSGIRLDVNPLCLPKLGDPKVPLFITEGIKKGDSLVSRGLIAVALTGVWNFKGKNSFGGTTFLNDWDYIAVKNREIIIAFDSDVSNNSMVRKPRERLTEHLQRRGAHVKHLYLPASDNGKVGIDDYLVSHPEITNEQLYEMASGPRPEIKPAPATVELLDEEPPIIKRPIALKDGRAYVATSCPVKVTKTESITKKGEIVRHSPPKITTELRPFIIRDDGVIFGDGGHKPFSDLLLEIDLPEILPRDKRFSTRALKAYADGYRADPEVVFNQVVESVDRFIDFDRSLADQRNMCELVACFIIATWYLPAFRVASIIWANGERGSGKTQLLAIIAELSYLGMVLLVGGSYAALRDRADYGSTSCYDDAENLADSRNIDPDKRTLMLAGSRQGNYVALKEKDSDGNWATRYVSTYSNRAFSSIGLPEPVLASRSLVIPLIRTPDRYRANADPLDFELWSHNRDRLVDDLWCLALAHLNEMPAYESLVNREARLTGRNLEPWRSILAVAKWLDDKDVTGLWQRMEQLSMNYQEERPQLELSDMQGFVIRGLLQMCANHTTCASCTNHIEYVKNKKHWQFISSQLAEIVAEVVTSNESDIDIEKKLSQRIGMQLAKMRLYKPPRPGGKGARIWIVTAVELSRWAISYGISIPEELEKHITPISQGVGTVDYAGTVGTSKPDISEAKLNVEQGVL